MLLRNPRFLFLLLLLAICSQSLAGECDGCDAVKKIDGEFRAYRGDDENVLDELQLKGTTAIHAIPRGKGDRLTRAQVKQIAELFRHSAPRDPAHAIIDNNSQIVKANLPAFIEEFKMMPVKEAQWLIETTHSVLGLGGDQQGEDAAAAAVGGSVKSRAKDAKATSSPPQRNQIRR